MEKVSKILNLVLKIMIVVLIGVTTLLSLTMAYIMFAPDNLPKPFYLSYQYPSGQSEGMAEAPVQVLPTLPPTATLEPGKGYMFSTGTKIINLAEASGKRYIRVSITLEFEPLPISASTPVAEGGGEGEKTSATTDANSELQTELTAKAPIIDDIIITLISQKSFDGLYTAEGKENLRAEIMNELNRRLPEYHVMSVYFTEFVVE